MCLQSIQRETMRVDGVDNTFKKPTRDTGIDHDNTLLIYMV